MTKEGKEDKENSISGKKALMSVEQRRKLGNYGVSKAVLMVFGTTGSKEENTHRCSSCPKAGFCPVETLMAPFEHDDEGIETLLNEVDDKIEELGGTSFIVSLMAYEHDPVKVIALAIALGYGIRSGLRPVKCGIDVKSLLSLMKDGAKYKKA